MIPSGTRKKTVRHPILSAFAIILPLVLVIPWIGLVAEAQTETAFTAANRFVLPGGTISFSVNGDYTQASIENGAWKFVGLAFRNFTQQGKLDLTVSVQDSNVNITSYRVTNPGNTTMGSIRIRYIVEGQGKRIFNFGPLPKHGYWDVIFDREYMAEHDGWAVSPDGTLTVFGAQSGTVVNTVYYILPDSFVDALSQPFYVQHSVVLATGVGVLVVVALCLAIWRKNLKATRQNLSLKIEQTKELTDTK